MTDSMASMSTLPDADLPVLVSVRTDMEQIMTESLEADADAPAGKINSKRVSCDEPAMDFWSAEMENLDIDNEVIIPDQAQTRQSPLTLNHGNLPKPLEVCKINAVIVIQTG